MNQPKKYKEYPIVSLTKEDLKDLNGFPKEAIDKLNDTDMILLAKELRDDYLNQMYWNSLEILGKQTIEAHEIVEVMDTPLKKLPLLIGSLYTDVGKQELEKKLKS